MENYINDENRSSLEEVQNLTPAPSSHGNQHPVGHALVVDVIIEPFSHL